MVAGFFGGGAAAGGGALVGVAERLLVGVAERLLLGASGSVARLLALLALSAATSASRRELLDGDLDALSEALEERPLRSSAAPSCASRRRS